MSLPSEPYNLIVCGVGGQGNILIARLIGRILARKGYQLAIGETFGAAQRGGSVFSSLRISSKKTYGPLVPSGRGNLIVSLEPLETLRMLSMFGNEDIVTVSNTQSVLPVGVLAGRTKYPGAAELREGIIALSKQASFVPSTDIAVELGVPIVSNIVLLGALLSLGLLPITEEEVKADMASTFAANKVELNYTALQRGSQATGSQG